MVHAPHRKVIAAVVTAAIVIAGLGASSARAGEYDTERVIAALLGLAVIGAIIADRNKDEAVPLRDVPALRPRPLPERVHRDLLPRRCLRQFQTNRGPLRMFGARCMSRNYSYVGGLPDRCFRSIRTDRGQRKGWGARCLRKQGYRVASH